MSKTIYIPVILARKVELVAKAQNITFGEAISFLLQKVEAPRRK